MKIANIVRFGVAALAMGAFFGVGPPVRADQLVWVRAQPLNYFTVRGLVPPGSFSHNENQKPATIAVNKTRRQHNGVQQVLRLSRPLSPKPHQTKPRQTPDSER